MEGGFQKPVIVMDWTVDLSRKKRREMRMSLLRVVQDRGWENIQQMGTTGGVTLSGDLIKRMSPSTKSAEGK